MNVNERLQLLRTKELKMSQEDFGSKIGVTRAAVSRYENGERSLSESIILSICREFRVNYYWLTEGDEPMFTGTPQNVVDEIAEEYDLDDIDRKIIEKYLELSHDQRMILKDYLKSIFT